jgi:hypothetical protein
MFVITVIRYNRDEKTTAKCNKIQLILNQSSVVLINVDFLIKICWTWCTQEATNADLLIILIYKPFCAWIKI